MFYVCQVMKLELMPKQTEDLKVTRSIRVRRIYHRFFHFSSLSQLEFLVLGLSFIRTVKEN